MGVILYRCTYGAAVKDAKEQIVAAIARYNEILRGSAKKSINMAAKGPASLLIVGGGGTSWRRSVENIDDELFKELVAAKSFEIEIKMERAGPTKPKAIFWYDEGTHHRNSVAVEFVGEFPESVTFSFLGFIGRLNEIKAAVIKSITDSHLSRMKFLWEDVFRMFVGAAMTKSEQKLNLRKYEVDSLMVNVFGNLVKIRENL